VANILTYIELDETEATPGSLRALNHGRDVATALGATLYAVLPCAATPSYDEEDIIAVLSRHGADKVILISHPQLVAPALFATHGEALVAACRQFPPRLMLFSASVESRDLAPRLAMSLRAHYAPDVRLELEDGKFIIHRRIFRRRFQVREPLFPVDHPLVLTLSSSGKPQVVGDDEAEVVVVHAPIEATPAVRLRRSVDVEPAGNGTITVGGGAGLKQDAFELLERLATSLGGSSMASTSARTKGLAKVELPVGMDGATVEAALYLALGISGSERHLAALAPHTEVVAVNTDPEAPIFRAAQHGMVADADDVIRQLLRHLVGRGGGR
jgi:electron transfer flavoprotein alpha subunit